MPVEPKLAATVILLRERLTNIESEDDCEFEVLMAKRHENARFMRKHYVFPGGSVDEQDLTNESKARIVGIDSKIVNNLKEVCVDPSILWITAIRELFEETGILIATNERRNSIENIEKNVNKIWRYQKQLQEKRVTMTDILIKEELYYDASKLKYFGRLITPALSPIRFDTQFFMCKLPAKQKINLFKDELKEALWETPKKLLELFKKRQIKIIFPQFSTLNRLKKFKTVQDALFNSKSAFRITRIDDIL